MSMKANKGRYSHVRRGEGSFSLPRPHTHLWSDLYQVSARGMQGMPLTTDRRGSLCSRSGRRRMLRDCLCLL